MSSTSVEATTRLGALRVAVPGEWLRSLFLVFVGCAANVVFLEAIVKEAPASTQLVTFAQFAFVALDGFVKHLDVDVLLVGGGRQQSKPSKDGTWSLLKRRHIPLQAWLGVVLLFMSSSVLNNWALTFGVSMPTQIVLRSGNLLANMLVGFLTLNRRYPLAQILSVSLVTAGVLLFTLTPSLGTAATTAADWGIGVGLLFTAMLLGCFLGLLQERIYTTYGRHPTEGMFYVHALSLPFFVLFADQMIKQTAVFSHSPPLWSALPIPRLWLYLLGNVLTQYMCISGVYNLTSITSSLTVQVVLTVRKTLSLVLSVVYFGNPFGRNQAIGAGLVFGGTLLYTMAETPQKKKQS